MSETKNQENKLTLSRPGRLELKKTVETGQVKQSFSHGRSKTVTVEVKRKRTFERGKGGKMEAVKPKAAAELEALVELEAGRPKSLTEGERAARLRALQDAVQDDERRRVEEVEAQLKAEEEAKQAAEDEKRRAEEEARRLSDEAARMAAEEEARAQATAEAEVLVRTEEAPRKPPRVEEEKAREEPPRKGKGMGADNKKPGPLRLRDEPRRRSGKGWAAFRSRWTARYSASLRL